MRLKKIEILGFKSFADKTKLTFDAGITAVVGPNGCGKSNIADAFRWVLGEQSAKSMRGSKMPDVIFAGTTHRKPLNFAEVTITLSEIEGRLPVEFEEIAVTRRLHRSGDSEYFINRHPVRLKDVQGLFLDSGMGKDAYSIFEQGKIDQVINLSPLERRYIFEEAAGILRFLQRKKEALRKLEQTELNVSRVKDIHKEVEKQIIVLEEQAEKARQYKEDKKTLEALEKTVLVSKWDLFQTRLSEAKRKAYEYDNQILATNAQIDSLHGQLTEAKQTLSETEKTLRHRGEDVFKAQSAKEIKSKEQQSNQERLKELLTKEKRWEQELEGMGERRKQRENERQALLKTQKELHKRLNELEKLVEGQRIKAKSSEEELSKQRQTQQSKQKDLFKLVQSENQSESEIRQLGVRLENAHERQAQIQERKERLAESAKALSLQKEEKKTLLEEAVQLVDGKKSTFASMETSLQEITEEMQKTQAEIDRLHQEISEGKARQKALQRLRDDMEGFSAGSKRLLQEAANAKSPLHQKIKGLYEYFSPQKGAEAALAAVMKPYAQTLVVETEEDFSLVMAFAKQQKVKDISILCLAAVSKIPLPKNSRSDSNLSPLAMQVYSNLAQTWNLDRAKVPGLDDRESVHISNIDRLAIVQPRELSHGTKSKFEPDWSIIENELSKHFLHGVFLAQGIATPMEAIKDHAGMELWIGDGAFIDRRSVVFYSSQGENNVFLREAELKALDKKLTEGETEKQKIDHILKAIQQKRNQLQQDRLELDKTIRREEMKLVEINFALQKASTDLEKATQEIKLLTQELQTVSKNIEDFTMQLNKTKQLHQEAKGSSGSAQKDLEALNELLDKLTNAMKQQMSELREKEIALREVTEEHRKQSHALNVLDVKDLESSQQEKRLEEEIEMGQVMQSQIHHKGSEVDKTLFEVEHTLTDVIAAKNELEQQVAVRKNALEHFESKISEKRIALKKCETDRNQISIQTAQLESNAQTIEHEMHERYQLKIQEARSEILHLDKSLEATEKQLKALRHQIENAGDINMTSIEECDKHKNRYHFLNQQIDDLGGSKQELVQIIAELDVESRKIFKQTFEQICTNFKKNFQILFSGGEADLQFTETADVLEAGIEIIAKPPGKQMRSINLLSGGEKCLTALALLFAIFEVKPAPFCILDEIDAPLDDTNVERFVNIVRQFADTCQFIIITHNKRTMAIADVIFGVSMEERGVSKLLSMDFSKQSSPELVSA